jgi:hypothetical protein
MSHGIVFQYAIDLDPSPLDPTQCVLPIPFRFVEETAWDIFGDEWAPTG